MEPRRVVPVVLVFGLLAPAGCSPPPVGDEPRHRGPKIRIADFINNTAAYKGKLISFDLKIEEAIDRSQGRSLLDYVGRDVKFMTPGPRVGQLHLVITIPEGLAVPEVGYLDDVWVTFVCTRGNLQQGNEAKSIEIP